jgi:hypothetical protein
VFSVFSFYVLALLLGGMLLAVHADQGPKGAVIIGPEHIPCVAIQGAVRCGGLQQGDDGATGRLDAPSRRPLLLEDVETDFSRLPVDVRMEALRHAFCTAYCTQNGQNKYMRASTKLVFVIFYQLEPQYLPNVIPPQSHLQPI